MVATTATRAAGTAATKANMATIRTCSPAPGTPRSRAWNSSTASVTTRAITSSTRRPVTTQMTVHTVGEGSILVTPERMKKDADDISTEANTTTKPSTRKE